MVRLKYSYLNHDDTDATAKHGIKWWLGRSIEDTNPVRDVLCHYCQLAMVDPPAAMAHFSMNLPLSDPTSSLNDWLYWKTIPIP